MERKTTEPPLPILQGQSKPETKLSKTGSLSIGIFLAFIGVFLIVEGGLGNLYAPVIGILLGIGSVILAVVFFCLALGYTGLKRKG